MNAVAEIFSLKTIRLLIMIIAESEVS